MTSFFALFPLFSATVFLFIFSFVFGQQHHSQARTAFLFYSGGFTVICFLEFFVYLPISREAALICVKVGTFILINTTFTYIYFTYAVAQLKNDQFIKFLLLFSIAISITSLFLPHHEISDSYENGKNGIIPTPFLIPIITINTIRIKIFNNLIFNN